MNSLTLALLLIITQPSNDGISENMRQTVDETGVRLGAYYGCYESEEDGLVCIFPEKPEKEEVKDLY